MIFWAAALLRQNSILRTSIARTSETAKNRSQVKCSPAIAILRAEVRTVRATIEYFGFNDSWKPFIFGEVLISDEV